MNEINIKTNNREEFIDITELVRKKISEKNFDKGLVHIFVPHATSGITINENADPNLPKDISNFLKKIVNKEGWMHNKIDNNADSHIKASLIGNSVSVPVENGNLMLGTWQNIFLCEFDGPRNRRIFLNFIK